MTKIGVLHTLYTMCLLNVPPKCLQRARAVEKTNLNFAIFSPKLFLGLDIFPPYKDKPRACVMAFAEATLEEKSKWV